MRFFRSTNLQTCDVKSPDYTAALFATACGFQTTDRFKQLPGKWRNWQTR